MPVTPEVARKRFEELVRFPHRRIALRALIIAIRSRQDLKSACAKIRQVVRAMYDTSAA